LLKKKNCVQKTPEGGGGGKEFAGGKGTERPKKVKNRGHVNVPKDVANWGRNVG